MKVMNTHLRFDGKCSGLLLPPFPAVRSVYFGAGSLNLRAFLG